MKPEHGKDAPDVKLRLTLRTNDLRAFSEMLQQGFRVRVRLGTSVRDVLCEQLGVTSQYLDQRINTIFLDGKPVDDAGAAIVRQDSVLALSAAMPGFVGAAFRKGGFYAKMRQQITHEREEASTAAGDGFFVLKLYNFVADELGPLFLGAGIRLRSEQLSQFMATRSEDFWLSCQRAEIDGRQVSAASLREEGWTMNKDFAELMVTTEKQALPEE